MYLRRLKLLRIYFSNLLRTDKCNKVQKCQRSPNLKSVTSAQTIEVVSFAKDVSFLSSLRPKALEDPPR